MEVLLEVDEKEKLISECLKLEIELKRLLKEWRVKEVRNLIMKRHNKVLNDNLVVLQRQSLLDEENYHKVISVKECHVMLDNLENNQDNGSNINKEEAASKKHQVLPQNNENKLETTDQQANNQQEIDQVITSIEKNFKCQHPGCKKLQFTSKLCLVQHKKVFHIKKYQCQDCQKCFDKPSHLQRHRRIHTGECPFECDRDGCRKRFKDKSVLERHIKAKHSNRKPLRCDRKDCAGKLFNGKNNLKQHLKSHSSFQPFQCQFGECTKRLKNKTVFKTHLKKEHKRLLNENELGMLQKLALEVVDDKKVIAVDENRIFLEVSKSEVFKCQHPGCGKIFSCRISLIQHRNVHTNKFQCQECQKCFPRIGVLQDHLRTHTGERPFACDHNGCGLQFKRNDDLRRHVNSKHSNEKPFQCDRVGCGKSFKLKSYLNLHLQYHSSTRSFQCQVQNCGYRFKVKKVFKTHLKKHKRMLNDDELATLQKLSLEVGDDKKVIVVDENQVFVGNLLEKSQDHISLPFQCPKEGCDKRFKTKYYLNKHLVYFHSDVKKFQCEFDNCQKSYKFRGDLKHHEKTHH